MNKNENTESGKECEETIIIQRATATNHSLGALKHVTDCILLMKRVAQDA